MLSKANPSFSTSIINEEGSINIVDLTEYPETISENPLNVSEMIDTEVSQEETSFSIDSELKIAQLEAQVRDLERNKNVLKDKLNQAVTNNRNAQNDMISANGTIDSLREALSNVSKKDPKVLEANLREMEKDFKNLTKRAELQVSNAEKTASEKMIKSMFKFFDAADAAKKMGEIKRNSGIYKMIEGLENTLIKEYGMVKINQTSVPFDPTVHNCIMTKKHKGMEPDIVITVSQTGYLVGDKLLRPALVIISS